MKETELAQKFVEYLSCYDLYFEVDYHRRVDIVAIEGKISSAYEVKTSFNFKVFEQALENQKHFNYSYICVPYFRDYAIQKRLCDDYGIGLIFYTNQVWKREIHNIAPAKLNRHVDNKKLLNRLSETNKKSIPGAKNGETEVLTAFGRTVEIISTYIRKHQGCTLKEAIENSPHHYRTDQSARSSLSGMIRSNVIKDIIIENGKCYYKQIQL